jgi:hypothetical protein
MVMKLRRGQTFSIGGGVDTEAPVDGTITTRLSRQDVIEHLRKQRQGYEKRLRGRQKALAALKKKMADLTTKGIHMERDDDIQMGTVAFDPARQLQSEVRDLERKNRDDELSIASLAFLVKHLDQRATFVLTVPELRRFGFIAQGEFRHES